ncbi:hypothetical protein HYH02_012457 [Chlamydomonas schloesseri]|uniref:NADP-dependent oxidoreductase domain-containing protein n=1 Tax=Chlamydomonas schloesseri TaxID=2026947 RepID=A0A835SYB5_9CHLO|nr:hypothetical protein HYH02_012457 [Chlamydomonas schloesseri]|eukprot:KAG2433996.1 hypothetical protein HYH02_012457 [Chlamydomonas schloesseri]
MAATMEYRRLGKTGLKVSALSYGAWTTFKSQADLEQAKELIRACVDAGINFFDNAEVYADGEAEVIMGQAIRDLGLKRSDLVLSTKIFWGGPGPNDRGLSRKHIIEGVQARMFQAALSRLQTGYVDLLFCHRPDPDTPIEETVRAMNHCLDRGWALYWGTSEWSAKQISQARSIAARLGLQPPVMEQPEYNLFERNKVETEYAPLYDTDPGLGLTVWSPLASGILTGKYGGGGGTAPAGSRLAMEAHKAKLQSRAHHIAAAERLKPLAAELGCSPAQLALAWTLTNPRVSTAITGASKVEQVRDNMGAVGLLPRLRAQPQLLSRLEQELAAALVEAEAGAGAGAGAGAEGKGEENK